MEAFLAKKENTDFEFIYRLLQDIKESNDAHFEKRRKQGELGQAEVVGQSKASSLISLSRETHLM